MGFSRQEYWSGLPCHPPVVKGVFLFKNVTRSNCQIVPNVKFHPLTQSLSYCHMSSINTGWFQPAFWSLTPRHTHMCMHTNTHINKYTHTHTHTLQFHLPSLVSVLALPHMIPIPALNIFPFTTEYKQTSYFPPPGNGNPSSI